MENLTDSASKAPQPGEYYLMGFGETDLIDRKRRGPIAVISLLAAVLLGLGIWLLYGQKSKVPTHSPTVSSPAPRSEPTRLQRLPPLLSRAAEDRSYSAAHPGRERYLSDIGEFLIFREGDNIKALQILPDKGRVIPDDFVRNLFKEMCRTDLATVTDQTRKGSYDVTAGKVGDSADFLIYRKPGSSDIRGIVLTFSKSAGP